LFVAFPIGKPATTFPETLVRGPKGRLYALSTGEGLILKRIKNKSVFGLKSQKRAGAKQTLAGIGR